MRGKLVRKTVSRALPEYQQVKELMKRAFPQNEQFPMGMLLLLAKKETVRFDAYYDDGSFCGLTYTAEGENMLFVLYLAVNDAIRSKGYGSAILETLKAESGSKSVSLNVEPLDPAAPNSEQRLKRMKFYKKNGFFQTGYFLCDGKDRYAILSTEQLFSPQEYKRAIGEMQLGPVPPTVEKG